MTTTPTTAVAVIKPEFDDLEQYALAAFLGGYRRLTSAYALDLRQLIAWCEAHGPRLFDVRRAGVECFARDLEARRLARSTVGYPRVAGFYRYTSQEGLLRAAV